MRLLNRASSKLSLISGQLQISFVTLTTNILFQSQTVYQIRIHIYQPIQTKPVQMLGKCNILEKV